MLPELAISFAELADLNAQAQKIVRGMDPRALDDSPGDGFNSPNAIVTHMAGSQRWWVDEILGQRDVHRDREAEFRAAGQDAEALARRLDDSLRFVKEVLETVTPEMLEQPRQARDRTVTVRYVLPHVVAHTAIHLGHLDLTRQLWESRKK